MPETTEQRNARDFAELCGQVDYIAGPAFKRDLFRGESPDEVAARDKFFHDLLHRNIVRGAPKDEKLTSLADTIQWMGPTFDIIHAKQVETLQVGVANGAKIDALAAALAGVVKALQGGEAFDQVKLTASIQEAVRAGVVEGNLELFKGLKVPATLSVEIGKTVVNPGPKA